MTAPHRLDLRRRIAGRGPRRRPGLHGSAASLEQVGGKAFVARMPARATEASGACEVLRDHIDRWADSPGGVRP